MIETDSAILVINFCPFCGVNLAEPPKETRMSEEWEDELEAILRDREIFHHDEVWDWERLRGALHSLVARREKAARIKALGDVKKLIASVEYMNDRLHSEQSPNDAKRVGAARAIKLLRELIEKERPA